MSERTNALLATSSLDRIPATAVLGSIYSGFQQAIQPTNSFRVQTAGANLIQGAINRVSVASIMFPYAVPTVVADKNDTFQAILIQIRDGAVVDQTRAEIFVPQGFYTGAELASAVQTAIDGSFVSVGMPAGTFTLTYDTTSRAIVFRNATAYNGGAGVDNWVLEIFATDPSANVNSFGRPNLLWTLGFRNYFASHPFVDTGLGLLGTSLVPYGFPQYPNPIYATFATKYQATALVGSMYLGSYTNFVDIVSPSLCRAQYVRDGTTAQGPTRRDIICRLYIANDINTYQENPAGTRPFVIHREFPNGTQKVMNWTTNTAIDYIDLELYDMYGEPLPNVDNLVTPGVALLPGVPFMQMGSGQPDYSISFHCHEHDETLAPNSGYRY